MAFMKLRMHSPFGSNPRTGFYEENGVETAIVTSNQARLMMSPNRPDMGIAHLADVYSCSTPGQPRQRSHSYGEPMLHSDLDAEKTTLNETAINAALALVGSGVLGVPFAFGQSGLVCGAVLASVTGLTAWTSLLIGELMECTGPAAREHSLEESAHDWPFLGYIAFGDAGRAVVTFCQLSELWGVMLGVLVVNGINLNLIFPQFSNQTCIIFSGCASFILLFPSAKTLSYFSVVGICATILAAVSLAWSAESMVVWESQVESLKLVDFSNIPMSLGIIQFCFVAHGAFPSMYREMQKPKSDYAPAMLKAFTFAGVFYLVVGIFAFYVYGSKAQPNFMQNLGRDLNLTLMPGKAFLYIGATAFFAVNIQASFPLFAVGLITASEMGLGISRRSFFLRTLWKLAFLAFTTGISVLLKDCLAPVLSLIGCVGATNTCLLCPMIFTLKLRKTSFLTKSLIGVVIIYSLFTLIVGTYTNVVIIANMLSGS